MQTQKQCARAPVRLAGSSCVASQFSRPLSCPSSSPRAFPLIWDRRNGYEYNSSTLYCPVRPPPLTPHFLYIFYTSLSTSFFVVLSLFPGTGASNILRSTCPLSLLLTRPHHLSLFSVIFFVTGATFNYPLTWSFSMLSFFLTPHIHRSILISFTSCLFSWLFVVDHVSALYSNAGLTTVLYIFPFNFTGIFLSYNTPLHFFQFPYSAFILCITHFLIHDVKMLGNSYICDV